MRNLSTSFDLPTIESPRQMICGQNKQFGCEKSVSVQHRLNSHRTLTDTSELLHVLAMEVNNMAGV